MRKIFLSFSIIFFLNPANAVTTRMFRVLDTCARYRLNEINPYETIEKLKLNYEKKDISQAKIIIKNYCSVFTPNEKIEF